jgi:hypothetical protein
MISDRNTRPISSDPEARPQSSRAPKPRQDTLGGIPEASSRSEELDREFVGWKGDVPGGESEDNPITITMDGDKVVTAHFKCADEGSAMMPLLLGGYGLFAVTASRRRRT